MPVASFPPFLRDLLNLRLDLSKNFIARTYASSSFFTEIARGVRTAFVDPQQLLLKLYVLNLKNSLIVPSFCLYDVQFSLASSLCHSRFYC